MKLYKKITLFTLFILTGSAIVRADINSMYKAKINHSDNRIKTYEYDEDSIFLVVIHHGYQTSIEFSKSEEIETLSIGDSYAWKITPVGKRLFIKPLEENIRTNMTIITNKRTYHFDIVSKSEHNTADTDLAYVVRFRYPDTNISIKNLGTDDNYIE